MPFIRTQTTVLYLKYKSDRSRLNPQDWRDSCWQWFDTTHILNNAVHWGSKGPVMPVYSLTGSEKSHW